LNSQSFADICVVEHQNTELSRMTYGGTRSQPVSIVIQHWNIVCRSVSRDDRSYMAPFDSTKRPLMGFRVRCRASRNLVLHRAAALFTRESCTSRRCWF